MLVNFSLTGLFIHRFMARSGIAFVTLAIFRNCKYCKLVYYCIVPRGL